MRSKALTVAALADWRLVSGHETAIFIIEPPFVELIRGDTYG